MTTARPALTLSDIKVAQLGDDDAPLRGFRCGEDQVDDWASKCHRWETSHKARAFCALMPECDLAYGFYSLSLKGESAKGLGQDILQAHNQGGYVPFVYIDFLGVQKEFQQQGLGELLLIDALSRCWKIALNVGFYGVALHSLNERTTALYRKYNFVVTKPDLRQPSPLMVLPVQFLFDLFGPVFETSRSGKKEVYVYPRMAPPN